MEKLFTAVSVEDLTEDNKIVVRGKELAIQAWGTWDNAIVKVYVAVADNITGVLLSDLTFTVDSFQALQVPAGCVVWATLTITGTSSISVWINGQGVD